MKIVFSTLLILLGFSGCAWHWPWTPGPTIVKYKYIKRPLPEIPKKPTAEKYQMFQAQLKGVDYFVLDKYNAGILDSNWISYKNWCESQNKILLNLKNSEDPEDLKTK